MRGDSMKGNWQIIKMLFGIALILFGIGSIIIFEYVGFAVFGISGLLVCIFTLSNTWYNKEKEKRDESKEDKKDEE